MSRFRLSMQGSNGTFSLRSRGGHGGGGEGSLQPETSGSSRVRPANYSDALMLGPQASRYGAAFLGVYGKRILILFHCSPLNILQILLKGVRFPLFHLLEGRRVMRPRLVLQMNSRAGNKLEEREGVEMKEKARAMIRAMTVEYKGSIKISKEAAKEEEGQAKETPRRRCTMPHWIREVESLVKHSPLSAGPLEVARKGTDFKSN
ncbi:hypothetical protein AMTR_s00168p00017430 [Amborella trichopoda]|uniref:Uncharacterized protein n=1 Tax=Amborella trichopoda TaxID=13333 RepID=W1PR25_AMBTC|nr:hypothetical protein AMTR_s00168p00017430 [Amborella trichopoda]